MPGEGSDDAPTRGRTVRCMNWMAKKRTILEAKAQSPKVRERKRKSVAIFVWAMFVLDVGSDVVVGFDLLNRCHTRAGWSILSIIWLPGCMFSLMKMLNLEDVPNMDCLDLLRYCITSFLLTFFTLPMTFGYLIADIFYETDDAKEFKFFEIFFEAYPQVTISLFIIMRLNISGYQYIASAVISFCSLLYGVADTITFKKFGVDAFRKTIWCMLSLFVDCLFRALFFSFLLASWVFPEKTGVFLLGLIYVGIIAFFIMMKNDGQASKEAVLKGAMASLVASAWQDSRLEVCKDGKKQELRFASKMVFNCLGAIALIVRSIQYIGEYIPEDQLDCTCLCPEISSKCPKVLNDQEIKNCLDRSLSLPQHTQLSIIVFLWILLVVSVIEGFMEKMTKLPLPFKKFQEEIPDQDCDNALESAS